MPGVGEDVGDVAVRCCGGRVDEAAIGLWLGGEGNELVFVVATELIDPTLPTEVAVVGRGIL